jgi:ankyrin repeat protein
MNINAFLRRLFHSPILRLVIITLMALACSTSAFCGEIHDAAAVGDMARLKALLKDNPELVFSKDSKGETPLYRAVHGGYKDVVKLLLAYKANANAIKEDGMTPLQ